MFRRSVLISVLDEFDVQIVARELELRGLCKIKVYHDVDVIAGSFRGSIKTLQAAPGVLYVAKERFWRNDRRKPRGT